MFSGGKQRQQYDKFSVSIDYKIHFRSIGFSSLIFYMQNTRWQKVEEKMWNWNFKNPNSYMISISTSWLWCFNREKLRSIANKSLFCWVYSDVKMLHSIPMWISIRNEFIRRKTYNKKCFDALVVRIRKAYLNFWSIIQNDISHLY